MTDSKVFLSHSSKNRTYVERVFSYLGPDRAFIDQYAFDDGIDLDEAIAEKVGASKTFALFLSKESISSKWVKAESRLAGQLSKKGEGMRLLFYIIDDTSLKVCPSWITKKYLVVREPNPELAAMRIRRAILEQSSESIGTKTTFVGRHEEIQRLDRIFGSPPAEQPRAIFIHGWEGMGRERLLMRAAGDNHIVRINLRDASGPINLFRDLLILLEQPDAVALHAREVTFLAGTSAKQSEELGKLIDAVLRKRFHLQITETNSLFLENGALVPWFSEAVNAFDKSSPYCVFVRTRRRPVRPLPRWRIDDIRLHELSAEEMESLLGKLLNESSVPFSTTQLKDAVEKLGGHPFSAYRFAGYAKSYGMKLALQNDAIMVQFRELLLIDALNESQLGEDEWRILFVVSRFRIVDIAALADYTTLPVNKIIPALERLVDTGMITHSGDLYSIAPFVRDPLQRHKAWPLDAEWTAGVDERVAHAVETFIDDGIGSSTLLDNAIAANLRLGRKPNGPVGNLVLGSHLFRVAREVYNNGDSARALELYREALRLRSTLAPEAISEALRFVGLCGVRLALDDVLDWAISQLNSLNLLTAKRNAAFLRGFRERRHRRYKAALPHFEESLRLSEHPHTLREAAFCALKLHDLPQARAWAERAVRTAQTNAYFLDVMCRVVLAEYLETRSREKELEFDSLLGRLKRACASTGDSFGDLRELERAVALQDVATAGSVAAKLMSSWRYDDIVSGAGAASLVGDEDISPIIKSLEKSGHSESRRRTDLEALKSLQAVHERRIDDAVRWLRSDRTDWELESVGITFGLVRRKILTRARAAIVAGDQLPKDTLQFVRSQQT